MNTLIEFLKQAGIILGAAASLYKAWKDVGKPFLIKHKVIKRKTRPKTKKDIHG